MNFSNSKSFVKELVPYAVHTQHAYGLPAVAMLAQAALETGWGKYIPKESFNLFGIKARKYQLRVNAETKEYEDGEFKSKIEPFRAFKSYEDAFDGYAELITGAPRYAEAAKTEDPIRYVREVHKAGYATDPEYANKVISIMDSVVKRSPPDYKSILQGPFFVTVLKDEPEKEDNMKKAFGDFTRELLFEKDKDRVSKTKAGAWLSVLFFVLKVAGVVSPEVFQALIASSGALLGIGLRDLTRK